MTWLGFGLGDPATPLGMRFLEFLEEPGSGRPLRVGGLWEAPLGSPERPWEAPKSLLQGIVGWLTRRAVRPSAQDWPQGGLWGGPDRPSVRNDLEDGATRFKVWGALF